ncbi:MAG: molecular chaperone TorD family protein [Burkholderiales bacterium]|nr:molecular chaperone TorD family protein [Burkholderiales bacterium]
MPEFDPARAQAQEDMCRYLAACFYEPEAAFAEERLFESLHAAALRHDPALADPACRLGEAFVADDPQTLLVDYTRLFLGPVQALARPYGSCWQTGEATLMQGETMAVLALYEQGGLELDEGFHELPDHVAVELEFLYLLLFQQHQAERAGDAQAAAAVRALMQRFLAEHLGAWVGPFTQAMHSGAQTAFYRELAVLTERFVAGLRDPAAA